MGNHHHHPNFQFGPQFFMESIADSLNAEKEKVCVTSKLLLLFELYACENLPSKLMTWFSIIDLNDIDDVFLSFSVFLPRRLLLHYILESDWEKHNQQTHSPSIFNLFTKQFTISTMAQRTCSSGVLLHKYNKFIWFYR